MFPKVFVNFDFCPFSSAQNLIHGLITWSVTAWLMASMDLLSTIYLFEF